MKMKKSLVLLFAIIISSAYSQNKLSDFNGKFYVELKNSTTLARPDEIIKIEINELEKKFPGFSLDSYKITENDNTVPAELISNYNGKEAVLLLNLNFEPEETKIITFSKADYSPVQFPKRTQAYLGEKKDYKRVDKFYKEGKFKSVNYTKMPQDHFAHDALYQFEGPGWESDRVAYRFYLDDRNRTDIFGKTTGKMVLNFVGIEDLDSGNEGYQNPQDWGMDIFKVGNSLGIGSIASLIDNNVVTISKTDSVTCQIIANDNLFSQIKTCYYGWNTGKNKCNLTNDISILAGSRLTKNDITITGNLQNICTGLAKHDSTEYLKSSAKDKNSWGYIALYGYQSRADDKLGIALFYKKQELISLGEDKDSYLVTLRPVKGKTAYYFAAAWEKEQNGIKTKEEFQKYLDDTINRLSNNIKIKIAKKLK